MHRHRHRRRPDASPEASLVSRPFFKSSKIRFSSLSLYSVLDSLSLFLRGGTTTLEDATTPGGVPAALEIGAGPLTVAAVAEVAAVAAVAAVAEVSEAESAYPSKPPPRCARAFGPGRPRHPHKVHASESNARAIAKDKRSLSLDTIPAPAVAIWRGGC